MDNESLALKLCGFLYIFILGQLEAKMHNNVNFELIVARERRRDLLRRAEQHWLIRLAKVRHTPGAEADRQAWRGLRIWMVWRNAVG